ARAQIGPARRPRGDDQAVVRPRASTSETYQALQAPTRPKQPHLRCLPSFFTWPCDHGSTAGAGRAAAAGYVRADAADWPASVAHPSLSLDGSCPSTRNGAEGSSAPRKSVERATSASERNGIERSTDEHARCSACAPGRCTARRSP